MMTLLEVELRRYLARRMTRFLMLVALAGIALVALLVFVNASDAPGERPRALDLWKDGSEPGILDAFAIVWMWISFVAGASFVGAEWRAGMITTMLTWEPRRARVFAAKAAVAGVLGATVVVALDVVAGLALWPTFALRGSTAGLDAEFWWGITGSVLRGGAVGAALALIAFAVASIGRNTAAALAGVLVYLIVAETILRVIRPAWGRWLLLDNLFIVIAGGSSRADADFSRTALGASVVVSAYVLALITVAGVAFVRRDVT
jgi:hypothetical protein